MLDPAAVVLDVLDADAVRAWSRVAVELVGLHRAELDALNVFPVPDGDTGANLWQTLQAADVALAESNAAGAAGALAAFAGGAGRAASGNSGFIVARFLQGLAEVAAAPGRGETLDAGGLASGLRCGATLARTAVVDPQDGTVLTVADAVADAVGEGGDGLAETVRRAVDAATDAVAATTAQQPRLAAAGVVDAGGRGLAVVLEALARVVLGRVADPGEAATHHHVELADAVVTGSNTGPGFEVQYLLSVPAADADSGAVIAAVRAELAAIGDSVVVLPLSDPLSDPHVWNVHVHVDDIGAALEAGLAVGRPHRVRVVPLGPPSAPPVATPAPVVPNAGDAGTGDTGDTIDSDTGDGGIALVAIAPGAGLAHLFRAEGVRVVESGSVLNAAAATLDRPAETERATDDLLDAVHAAVAATRARQLVLLPNASQITGVAEAAAAQARAAGLRVAVVPTRSPVQGLAAIAVHDAARDFDDDVVAMAEAAAATRFAHLVFARDRALTAVGVCEPGDVLGMIDGEVVEIGRGLLAVAFGVADRLVGVGAELMTVLVGRDAPIRSGELVEAHVRGRSPLTDVTVYQGGQGEAPLIIGVE